MKKHLLPFLSLLLAFASAAQPAPRAPGNTAADFSGFKLRNIGPAFMSGRIADVVKDPADPSTWYVATASGGVWKTTNNATTWTPVFDRYSSYTTGAIAIDPADPHVLWLGTGENASQRSAGYGDGVYKSTDGGKSWQRVGLEKSEHIGKILIDPRNTGVVYVAAQGPLWAPGGDRGLYKTTNGGENWEKVLDISENTGITDIVFDPRNPDVIYAAAYQRRRHVGILVAGGPESAIYKTTDAGKTWRKLSRGLPAGDKGRIALAVSPQRPDIVYALIAAEEGQSGFFRSEDRGESWQKQSDYIVVDPQYYGEIYADPHHFERVYAMDVIIHVTDDGGRNFRRLNTRHKHVDNHSLLFDPSDPDYLLVGCDGGLYESWDQGETWRYIDNLPITQFYRVGIDNAEPFYNVYGGTQDNSTIGAPSQTNHVSGIRNSDWFITTGGDGFQTRVDPTNPDLIYSMSQYGVIVRYDKRSGERVDVQPQPEPGEEALRWHWDAPLIISPHQPSRLYFAAQRLFRSDDRGNTWRAVSGDLSRHLDRNKMPVMGRVWGPDAVWKNVFTSPFGTITALAESPLQEGLLAVGTDDGLIQVSEDGGRQWRMIDRFTGVPDMTYVSDLIFSPHNRSTIYALFNNHKNGDFKPYALKSTDLGRSWSSVAGDLPDRHITWSIIEDHEKQGLLFLGTEFGLFFSPDDGRQWIPLKGNVPTVAFRDLEIQRREDDLVAASFGRGMFILDDYSPLRLVPARQAAGEPRLFPVKDARMYVEASPIGGPKGTFGDGFFTAPNPPFGAVFTYFLPEGLLSKKQQRRMQEKASLKDRGTIDFPSWEALREEDLSEDPAIVLTVTDTDGQLVRRLEGPAAAGFHRLTWDLRYPDLRSSASGRGRGSGPQVVPGTYTVRLSKYADGQWEDLSAPQSFRVSSLELATLPAADEAAALAFQQRAARLQHALMSMNSYIEDKLGELAKIKTALFQTEGELALLTQAGSIERKLKDLQMELSGDETRNKRAEFIAPGLLDRIQRAVWGQYNSSGPTQTHEREYGIAREGFLRLRAALEQLAAGEMAGLYRALSEKGYPWTPGQGLPQWRD